LRPGVCVELAHALHVVLGIALEPCDDNPHRGQRNNVFMEKLLYVFMLKEKLSAFLNIN